MTLRQGLAGAPFAACRPIDTASLSSSNPSHIQASTHTLLGLRVTPITRSRLLPLSTATTLALRSEQELLPLLFSPTALPSLRSSPLPAFGPPSRTLPFGGRPPTTSHEHQTARLEQLFAQHEQAGSGPVAVQLWKHEFARPPNGYVLDPFLSSLPFCLPPAPIFYLSP